MTEWIHSLRLSVGSATVSMSNDQHKADLAHELRTPLAILKTSTEIALLDPLISASVRATLIETLAQVDRMSGAIDTYLKECET